MKSALTSEAPIFGQNIMKLGLFHDVVSDHVPP